MIIQNPLVPPAPGVAGNTAAPVANAPAASKHGKPETQHPVTAAKRSERTAPEDTRRPVPQERAPDPNAELGQELDILV